MNQNPMQNSDEITDAAEQARLFLGDGAKTLGIEALLDLLLKYRNDIHPDRFTENGTKEKASESFKQVQNLIDELDHRRQQQIIQRDSKDIVKQQESPKALTLRLELNRSANRIDDLKKKVEDLQLTNKSLNDAFLSEKETSRNLELENLRKMYEPSKARIVGVAIAVILGGVLATITQIDQIAVLLKQYSPFSPSAFNISVFTICISALVMTVIKYLKHLEYRYMMRQVCTTSFATGFLSFAHDYHQDFDRTYRLSFVYQNNSENLLWSGLFSWMCEHKDKLTELDENFQKRLKSTERMFNQFIHHFEPKQGDESFNEHTVLKYIELYYGRSATGKGRHLFSLRKLRRAYRATHGLYSNEAKDHLKDAFILHLINRQLVDDPRAGGLVHRFHIK